MRKRRDFAEELKAARTAAGLSQAELARRTDLPQPHISKIEAGKSQPSWETACKLIEACGRQVVIK